MRCGRSERAARRASDSNSEFGLGIRVQCRAERSAQCSGPRALRRAGTPLRSVLLHRPNALSGTARLECTTTPSDADEALQLQLQQQHSADGGSAVSTSGQTAR